MSPVTTTASSRTNQGFGTFTISADGDVTGRYASGIFGIQNGEGMMTIMTGADSDVLGGKDGIDALNFGNGALFVNVAGRVTGQGAYNYEDFDGDGIRAANFGGTLTIVTAAGSTVTGLGDDGIDADHYGYGDLTITVNGMATGQGEDGSGIEAYNRGYINTYQFDQDPSVAETIITVGPGGVAQGNFAGIHAESSDGQPILITNDGLVRNLSGESHRQAIVTSNASTSIANNANLIGTVTTDVNEAAYFDDSLINNGFWNSAGGMSDFGRGTQDTVINAGVIVAADDSTELETTTIARIEYFNNEDGIISLIDGQAGDIFQITSQWRTLLPKPRSSSSAAASSWSMRRWARRATAWPMSFTSSPVLCSASPRPFTSMSFRPRASISKAFRWWSSKVTARRRMRRMSI